MIAIIGAMFAAFLRLVSPGLPACPVNDSTAIPCVDHAHNAVIPGDLNLYLFAEDARIDIGYFV